MSARVLLSSVLLAALSFARTAIVDLRCDPAGPDHYRITYSGVGAVRIFASHSPDSIDANAPMIAIAKSPAEFDLPGFSGRPYFHCQPSSGASRVVSIRRLPLEGQENFRDLGGYPTVDGGTVKWGKLYRSGQLSAASEKDLAYLNSLGVKLVCDFRAGTEREAQPTRWTKPELISQPIGDDPDGKTLDRGKFEKVFLTGGGEAEVRGVMLGIYSDLLPRATPRYVALFKRLLANNTPMMVHCTSGKDRTGVFSALLLEILGVPRKIIMDDYLLTNEYALAPENLARAARSAQKQYGLSMIPDGKVISPMIGVEAVYLESIWRDLDRRYGNFDKYRRKHLGLSGADVKRLRVLYVSHP